MALEDPARILALLRDPNVGSQEVADETGLPRAEAARAARLLFGLAKARPEEIATLPPPLAAALVQAAVDAERLDVLSALAAGPDKALSKEAKRFLHILKAKGVQVPEPPRAAPPPPPQPAEEVFPCYASSIDGQGERAVWVSRNVPGRGVEVGQAVVSDTQGLLELQVGVLGRKEYRTFGREIAERGRAMGVGEIDPGEARWIVAEARKRNAVSGRTAPEGADAWLARIGPGAAPADPAQAFPPLEPAEEAAAVTASAELHALPMLKGWLADEAMLRALAARLDEIGASREHADEAARAARLAEATLAALESWLDEACRARLATRLHDVAAHLRAIGIADRAVQAAAVARALAAGTPGAGIPFVRQMVEKAFPARGAAPAVPVISAQKS
ncbi:MAG TPA: hypothetical protein VFM53_10685 [Anaeromyxobacteraceae bacterium]|nr:hypothetical protein [Anaeromyxobacteraceae bacterium]